MAETSLYLSQIAKRSHESGSVLDFEAGFTNQLSSTARSQQADIVLDQALSQIEKTRLVEDRQYGWYISVLGETACCVAKTYLSFRQPL
jgi:hypothetical protein